MANTRKRSNRSTIINQLFKEEKWSEARELLLKWLQEEPNNHWFLTRISTIYLEEKQYDKALEYVEQALQIAPRCPLVLWDYAEVLDRLKRNEEAIQIYKKIIRRGISRTAYGECGEGLRWARSIINDSRYMLGLIYASMSKFQLAGNSLKKYIANHDRNTPSIYDLREVKKDLKSILEGKDPRS
jgi:tetratricopeptide (TPR) repeat protein